MVIVRLIRVGMTLHLKATLNYQLLTFIGVTLHLRVEVHQTGLIMLGCALLCLITLDCA